MRKASSGSQPWLLSTLETAVYNYFSDHNYTTNGTLSLNGEFVNGTKNVNETLPVNCIRPSIEEFPEDFFHDGQRLRGGFLVHAAIVAYTCSMLAIVCERYFVPSLKVICKHFNLPPDIAGATFMALGTSSPELFSSLIGAFIAKGDIGVGTVVGSAVFNILGVTGVSGLVIGTTCVHLEWYPITRDISVYVVTVTSLVLVIRDNIVTWYEAACLLTMFAGYLVILRYNKFLKNKCTKMVKKMQTCIRSDSGSPKKKSIDDSSFDESTGLLLSNSYQHTRYNSYNDSACPSSESSSMLGSSDGSDTLANERADSNVSENQLDGITIMSKSNKYTESVNADIKKYQDSDNSNDEFEDVEHYSLISIPQGFIGRVLWLIMWPGNLLLVFTIPSCDTPKKLKWFPLTFTCSIIWLGFLSYVSFWMVATIGYTFGIPDTVSGLTILAAGTSIPELVASVIVIKSGMPNMALANLVSSNIFDILFCLGLPWLVKALLNHETLSVVINSSALTYTTLILLSTVVLFYLSLLLFRWRYGWRVGVVALVLYTGFLVLASLYETNMFGEYNPPACSRRS